MVLALSLWHLISFLSPHQTPRPRTEQGHTHAHLISPRQAFFPLLHLLLPSSSTTPPFARPMWGQAERRPGLLVSGGRSNGQAAFPIFCWPLHAGTTDFFFFFFFSLSLPFSDPSAKAEILAAHARRGERNNGAWKSLGDRRSWLGQGNVITFVNEGPFFPFPPKGAAFVPTFRNDSFLCFLLVLFFFFWFAGSTLARRTDPSARP